MFQLHTCTYVSHSAPALPVTTALHVHPPYRSQSYSTLISSCLRSPPPPIVYHQGQALISMFLHSYLLELRSDSRFLLRPYRKVFSLKYMKHVEPINTAPANLIVCLSYPTTWKISSCLLHQRTSHICGWNAGHMQYYVHVLYVQVHVYA